jgi:hypothetical protein
MSAGLTQLIWSLALMTLLKNLRRHNDLPPACPSSPPRGRRNPSRHRTCPLPLLPRRRPSRPTGIRAAASKVAAGSLLLSSPAGWGGAAARARRWGSLAGAASPRWRVAPPLDPATPWQDLGVKQWRHSVRGGFEARAGRWCW